MIGLGGIHDSYTRNKNQDREDMNDTIESLALNLALAEPETVQERNNISYQYWDMYFTDYIVPIKTLTEDFSQ